MLCSKLRKLYKNIQIYCIDFLNTSERKREQPYFEKENNLTLGVFYSTENPRLNFWKFPVTNGQFSQISGKGENLARYIMYIGIFRTFLPEILVSFDFHSGGLG